LTALLSVEKIVSSRRFSADQIQFTIEKKQDFIFFIGQTKTFVRKFITKPAIFAA